MIIVLESMGPADIELMTPGSAIRRVSAVRRFTDCATWPCLDCEEKQKLKLTHSLSSRVHVVRKHA